MSAVVPAVQAQWQLHPLELSVFHEYRTPAVRAETLRLPPKSRESDFTDCILLCWDNCDLTVPFPTPLEAEITYGSLAADAKPHQGLVGKELKVSGSILEVHWTAEDSRILQISIINFFDQLSLVVNTIQCFGPQFPDEPGLGNGAQVQPYVPS